MTPHSELFAEDFHAYSVTENYPEKELTVDLEGFYKGYDEGKVFSCKCILLVSPENEWLESGFNKESKDQPRYT